MANALIVKPLPFVSVAASGTTAGYSPDYIGNDFLGVVWLSAAGSSATLTVDMGANVTCDTALLLGCTGATASWTLKVEAATASQGSGFPGGSWVGEVLPFLAGSEMPKNGRGVALWQAPASPPPASRYWRFTIGGLAGAKAMVGRLVLGASLQTERNFAFGAAFGARDLGSVEFSRLGVMLSKSGAKLRQVGISYGALHKSEVEAGMLPLIEDIGNTAPVAIVTDPAAHPMRQRRAYFGPLVGDLGMVWRKADQWQTQFNLVSLI